MALREWINKNQKMMTAAVGLVIAVAIGLIAYQLLTFGQGSEPQTFFSNDDGKTFFRAGISSIPPFDHRGKEAVRATVFRIDGKDQVGYLERYTPAGKELAAKIAKARMSGEPVSTADERRLAEKETEVKKPGEADWISSADRVRAGQITETPPGDNVVTVVPD